MNVNYTICPRSLVPFYIENITKNKTSWTYSTENLKYMFKKSCAFAYVNLRYKMNKTSWTYKLLLKILNLLLLLLLIITVIIIIVTIITISIC